MTFNPSNIVPEPWHLSNHGKYLSFLASAIVVTILLGGFFTAEAQAELPAYKNPDLPVDVRAADLVGRMTLEEKARQLDMYFGCEIIFKHGPTGQHNPRKTGCGFQSRDGGNKSRNAWHRFHSRSLSARQALQSASKPGS